MSKKDEMYYALSELVLDYSYREKEFDKNFIIEAVKIILYYRKELRNWVDKIDFLPNYSINDNGFSVVSASYSPATRKLNLSPQMLINKYNDKMKVNLDVLEYYIYINLKALAVIMHELEHANQIRIMSTMNDPLSLLITNVLTKTGAFCEEFIYFLQDNGYSDEDIVILSNKLYADYELRHDFFPTERSADVISNVASNKILDIISNTTVLTEVDEIFNSELRNLTYNGYSFDQNGNCVSCPLDLFMRMPTILKNMLEQYSGVYIDGNFLDKYPRKTKIAYGGKIKLNSK